LVDFVEEKIEPEELQEGGNEALLGALFLSAVAQLQAHPLSSGGGALWFLMMRVVNLMVPPLVSS